MPANGKTNGGFQPLALAPINYSLTDGTSIPPPPESPVDDAPPVAPVKDAAKAARPPSVDTNINGNLNGRGRSSVAISAPMSPPAPRRPSSIRNFLARKSLLPPPSGNGMNFDGSTEDLTERPDSVASFRSGGGPSLVKKKSWFRRLSSVPRSSTVYEAEPEQKRPAGPPPPTLPELSQLKAKIPEDDEGGLGGESMFKNIS